MKRLGEVFFAAVFVTIRFSIKLPFCIPSSQGIYVKIFLIPLRMWGGGDFCQCNENIALLFSQLKCAKRHFDDRCFELYTIVDKCKT